MGIELMPQRPPFVIFEQRPVEDRNASIEAGGLVMKDVDYVVVRQPGSKDTMEKDAQEWLSDIASLAQTGNYPTEWVQFFRQKYDAWKAGQVEPELGLSVRQWPPLSKAQAENLIAAGIRTVEDAAVMNEQAMQRIGMGAREIKRKAEAYMQTRDSNKAAEKVVALEAELADAKDRNTALEARLAALEVAMERGKKRA